jgi:hypothetical protein
MTLYALFAAKMAQTAGMVIDAYNAGTLLSEIIFAARALAASAKSRRRFKNE